MSPKKILVVQLKRVGDVIFTLPVIEILRKYFPDAQIDFLVERPSDQLVQLNPHLNETLVYEKSNPIFWIRKIRERRYDCVLDFLSNGRTLILTLFSGAQMRVGFSGPITRRLVYTQCVDSTDQKYLVEQKLDLLRALGLSVNEWRWDLKLPRQQMNWAEDFLKQEGRTTQMKNLVGIAPASRRSTRTWIPKRFAEVLYFLTENAHDALFLWGPGEKEYIDAILSEYDLQKNGRSLNVQEKGRVMVPPETSLIQLSALIQKCSLVIGVDNGPKNIAVALGVPTITILGPTNPLSFNPRNDPVHAIIRDEKLFCISCGLNICPYRHECMDNISSELVIQKTKNLLNSFSIASTGKIGTMH